MKPVMSFNAGGASPNSKQLKHQTSNKQQVEKSTEDAYIYVATYLDNFLAAKELTRIKDVMTSEESDMKIIVI